MKETFAASVWHTLTVERDGGELDYDTAHPADCGFDPAHPLDPCWFLGEFFESEDRPTEPGVYRARVWMEQMWAGDWDGGNEWEPVTPEVSS